MKTALKIVGIIGLVLWIACCFFGLFYGTNGNWLVTIVITLLVGVALFLSYLLMLKMQDKGVTQGNRDRAKRTGIIMLCVYVLASLASAFYINHLVKTEVDEKEQVKTKALQAINELKTFFNTDTESEGNYRWYVESFALPTYETRWLENNEGLSTESKKYDSDMEEFESYLLGISDSGNSDAFTGMEKAVNKDIKTIEKAFKNWNVFTSPVALKQLKHLEKQKPEYEKWLADWAKSREDEKYDEYPFLRDEERFTVSPAVDCTGITAPLTQTGFNISGLAILIILALQVIILLGYLLGLKTGGKNDKITTDEHGSMRSWSSTK